MVVKVPHHRSRHQAWTGFSMRPYFRVKATTDCPRGNVRDSMQKRVDGSIASFVSGHRTPLHKEEDFKRLSSLAMSEIYLDPRKWWKTTAHELFIQAPLDQRVLANLASKAQPMFLFLSVGLIVTKELKTLSDSVKLLVIQENSSTALRR